MNVKLKKEILEAIDQLRGRKARPDIERICNHVQRRYNVDPQETLADLERLVDEEQVIRVEYKGSTSYRNVAKWPRYRVYKNKPNAANLVTLNSQRTSSMLEGALKVLISQKPLFRVSGVPYEEIQKYLINIDDNNRFKDKNHLDTVLAREMNSGNIVMLENGNYVLETRTFDIINSEIKLDNLSALSPKKLMNPWTLDIKEEIEDENNVDSAPLSPKTQRMYDVLKICKTLRDAERKVINKRKKDDLKSNRNISVAASATAAPSESEEGASLAPGNSATPAMRVGSRRKRARQVFDPSDNNLPRNRKRGRPITGNTKQLQQHAIQHQLLRMRHQQNISPPPTPTSSTTTTTTGSPPTPAISTTTTTTTTNRINASPTIKQEPKIIVPARTTVITPIKSEPIKDINNIEIPSPIAVKKLKITPVKPKSPKPPKTPPKSLSPSPSPDIVTPNHSTSVSSDEAPPCCIVCKDDISSKSFRLVTCQTCRHRVHPLCLKNLDDPTLQPAMKHALKWKCMQCRRCTICNTGRQNELEFLVVCQLCDDAFHASCHSPALIKRPRHKWLCYACTVKKALSVGQSMVTYGDKNSAQSLPIMHVRTSNGNMEIDESSDSWDPEEMGEVMNWSSDDVSAYFTSQGFSEEAAIMREQDVDGKSLLLMKRIDVLRGLKLKLGPALKIYNNHVLRMQHHHFNEEPADL